MTITKENIVESLARLENYFKSHLADSPLFEAEHRVCTDVLNLITESSPVTQVIDTANQLRDQAHYAGSAWHEVQLLVCSYARMKGLCAQLVKKQNEHQIVIQQTAD